MFIEVLCGLHWWLCKHLSGIPFPVTLDQEHQEWQMQLVPWFAVSSVECCEYEHCRRFASRTPRNKNPGVSGPESVILNKWASPWVRCARKCLPSLPPYHYPQFHQLRDGKLCLSFIWHLFHASVMFHSNNIIIRNPTMTFWTHCVSTIPRTQWHI
jgi:hypothetical protein